MATQSWLEEAATAVLDVTPNPDNAYSFYNGTEELRFDESEHVYYRINPDGQRQDIPGVTTILGKAIDKSFALVPWATKLTVENIRAKLFNADGSINQLGTEEWNQLLDESKNRHRQKLEDAGDIGRIAHDFLERIAKDAIANSDGYVVRASILPEMPNGYVQGTDLQLELRTSMARKCVMAALDWIRRHHVQFVHAERKIYSRSHNFAGTVDGVAYMDSCDDLTCCRGASFKRTCVCLDYKSSNEIRSSYAWQLVAYQFALIEELDLPITHRVVLRLGKEDGRFEPWLIEPLYFTDDLKTFLDALSLYNSLEHIEKRRSDDKKELRAAIKAKKDADKAAAKEAERLAKQAKADAVKAIKAEEKAEREAAKAAKAKPAGPVLVQGPFKTVVCPDATMKIVREGQPDEVVKWGKTDEPTERQKAIERIAKAADDAGLYDEVILPDDEPEPGIAHTVQASAEPRTARFWTVSSTYTDWRVM